MSKSYIGLATTCHDPAIAIVDAAGEVVFAEATERFLQNKRAWNCVPDSFLYTQELLEKYCSSSSEIVIAKTWSRNFTRSAAVATKLMPMLKRFLSPPQYAGMKLVVDGIRHTTNAAGGNIRWRTAHDVTRFGARGATTKRIVERSYDHHLTHAATACFSSAFDEALCVVMDGNGEWTASSYYEYKRGKVQPLQGIGKPRMAQVMCSLGLYYALLSEVCGFESTRGEEWKLMGLAPYGELDEDVYRWLRPIYRMRDKRLVLGEDYHEIVERLARLTRPPDAPAHEWANLAFTGHEIFCEFFREVLLELSKLEISDNLVLAGGCALNSAWAGRVLDETPFRRLFIPSAPADDGNAIGAALLAYQEDHPDYRPPRRILSPYLGRDCPQSEALNRLEKYGGFKHRLPAEKSVCERTAELLAGGKLVGWVQGRAEFGPRALGNRSILADPRSARVKDRLNSEVKFREEFRPFAPSVLHEHGDEYFENYRESPYMERALRFRSEAKHRVPGVVHVDGTGRLQTVKEEWNPRYYRLISAFHRATGIPILLNTSFNVMGRPIVHAIEDCVAVFMTSGLDALVIGDALFEKDW